MKTLITNLVFVFAFFQISQAQENADTVKTADLYEMSLEELLNVKIEVATKKETSLRENPAVVTVINQEDIRMSGARDLQELFTLLVPGFQFIVDVEGVVGLGIRGLLAHEGKHLFMIDGMDINEEMFATVVYGNHFSLDMVERIEIIRGPGSAMYGGFAGLSVINIITRNAKENKGYISKAYSKTKDAVAYNSGSIGYGTQKGDLGISMHANYSQALRSNMENIDYYGDTLSMKDNSQINSMMFKTAINYKGLSFNGLADIYQLDQIDLWGENYTAGKLSESWDTYIGKIAYKFQPFKVLELTPYFQFKKQYPWQLSVISQEYVNTKSVEKTTLGLNSFITLSDNLNILLGGDYYESALINEHDTTDFEEDFKNGKDRLSTNNLALFGQILAYTDIVNFTLGGRYDYSSDYGSSFVPRLAITKQINDFHFKFLASQAFRIPGGIIPNRIPIGEDDIQPEKANNIELELGYQLTDNWYASVNVFDVSFDKVIVYGASSSGTGTYINKGKIGSQGIESDVKYRSKKLSAAINYAYYQKTTNSVEVYEVPDNDNALLAMSQHRLNLYSRMNMINDMFFNTSASYFGKRYGYTQVFEDSNLGEVHLLQEFDPTLYLNSGIEFDKLLNENLNISFNVKNILNQEVVYIQPYKGWHAPLPGLSRSFDVKVILKI